MKTKKQKIDQRPLHEKMLDALQLAQRKLREHYNYGESVELDVVRDAIKAAEKSKPENKCKYFLFGDTATDIVENGEGMTSKQMAKEIKKDIYGVFEYHEGETSPQKLLNEYDGWNAFMEISKDLYDLL